MVKRALQGNIMEQGAWCNMVQHGAYVAKECQLVYPDVLINPGKTW